MKGAAVTDEARAPASARRSAAVLARFGHPPSKLAARLVAAAPFAAPAAFLAWVSIGAVLRTVGHPGAALDDSFIHFQYARAIAEGHPFRFERGEPPTMGATSALWPLLLAPFYLVGFDQLAILWPAWLLSFGALGLLSREVWLLAMPLAGRSAAAGAGATVFAFSAFTWCAGSGMEVVPFAWVLTRAARKASEWVEGARDGGREKELIALAFVAPLLRPEGALASVMLAVALVAAPREPSPKRRALGLAALFGAITPQLLSLAVTGHLASNTAAVKLLPGNPYYVGAALEAEVARNVHTLVHVLLNGEVWSAEFLPHGSMPFAFAGLVCLAVRGRSTGFYFRAGVVLLLALALATPCAYVSFLWNRLRYLWPFAPFWLVGLACLSRVVGDALGRLRPSWRVATPILAGMAVGLLASKLEGTLDDLANSVSGIDRQQVALGLWARENIPAGARIGVNDTGAIAYFGDHPTFDVVGLTTEGEGRYWVAGAASRFEHYERLAAEDRARLPAYFIVYPEWMALDAVLGPRLHEAVVTDSTILGGQVMVVYEADYTSLGSGELPWTHVPGELVDAVDVADLDSEGAHGYELLGAPDGQELVTRAPDPGGRVVVDGGRRERSRDRFRLNLAGGGTATAIVRYAASGTERVRVVVDGKDAATFTTEPGEWHEAAFTFQHGPRPVIDVVAEDEPITTYHYWFY